MSCFERKVLLEGRKLTICGCREAVRWMVDPSGASSEAQSAPASTASRGFKAVEGAFEAAIGLDEPPAELAREL